MGTLGSKRDEEEFSVIGEKEEIGFIDYINDQSVCSYNPAEEGPVTISVPFAFTEGKPQSVFVDETTADSITIKNTTSESIELWSIRIYNSNPKNSFTLSLMKPPSKDSDDSYKRLFLESYDMEDRVLQPGQLLTIWLSCKPKEIGQHTSAVHFDVDGNVIERMVLVLAEDKISQSLNSNKPYLRPIKKNHFNVQEPVKGVRPASITDRVNKPRLLYYNIPRYARELLESKQTPDAIKEGLTRANYKSFFTNLLIMEELHMEDDMMAYDMERVFLRKKGTYYLALQVPGLAERKPSLVHGDYICVQYVENDANDTVLSYQGYIHRVDADEVYLKFDTGFHTFHRDSDLCNVRFTYNRTNMRRLYQAVDVATKLDTEFLFPSISSPKRCLDTTPLVPISCILNEEQIFSVEMILGCKEAPPYVIFGPPGTGKTMTLVEVILQLYNTRENSRILICSASNSAADYILEKLINEKSVPVQQKELFRLNATSRACGDINPDYMRFCFSEELVFKCPSLQALMRYRIIISTYMSASTLFAEGVQKGHFSHIFLDEAGQASEPETMIPLSNFCQKDTVVVLAGDPMQLGPVVYSRVAESLGLGKSYLQRLFECEFYQSEDENYVTKLVRNYRSHPEILYLPSKLFYQGELIACNDDIAPSMSFVDILPNKEFPVLFIGVQGCDEREGNNPSWFNRFEASKVVEIIKKLTLGRELNEEDIGVITPYRQQVLKIKSALDTLDMDDIKVGSVEQFQGQERQVIIISSVRSTIKHNEFDRTFCLGFLSNPRRFNVAITRAKSLLIIIGNPHIVCKDPYWNKLLWRCSDNGSYQGCVLPDREEYPDDDPPEQEDEFNYKGQENDQESFQPVGNDEVAWGEEPSQSEWNEKPVTDDAQWSTGWKDSESSQEQEKNYVTCNSDWNRKEDQAEWSQQSFHAENHGNQEVEWNQESNLAEWDQKPSEPQNHLTQKGRWYPESDEEDWNQKSFGRQNHMRNIVEWNREFDQGETSGKAANDEVTWNEQYSQPVWNEKPVTNQEEWNDWNM